MEEKKRRGVIRIPHDIVEEILVKLPVKSMLRFKAVSREWRGTVESNFFVEKHKRHQKSRQATIYTVKSIRMNLEKLSFMCTNKIVDTCPYRLFRHRFRSRRACRYDIPEPCDGLFCFFARGGYKIYVVNPATDRWRSLPDSSPKDKSNALLGIGRESRTCGASPRYKLLCIFKVKETTRCKVYALDSKRVRYIDPPPPNCQVFCDQPMIHLDGVLYCFAQDNTTDNYKLLAFDLHTETFQSFSLAHEHMNIRNLRMCLLNNRLCISSRVRCYADHKLCYRIWSLDLNKRSWETMYSIDFTCFPPAFKGERIIPMATINDHHLILSNRDRDHWVLYNSKTRSVHQLIVTIYPRFFMSFHETLVSVYQ